VSEVDALREDGLGGIETGPGSFKAVRRLSDWSAKVQPSKAMGVKRRSRGKRCKASPVCQSYGYHTLDELEGQWQAWPELGMVVAESKGFVYHARGTRIRKNK